VDAGRRFLQCADVLNPCDFKHWIDPEFSGRAKQVIQDLVAMNGSSLAANEKERSTPPNNVQKRK
jgi:hypothetical protein